MALSNEDIALGFASVIALVLNLVPAFASAVPPQYSAIVLALGGLLKALLGNLQGQDTPLPETLPQAPSVGAVASPAVFLPLNTTGANPVLYSPIQA